jgi:maltose-binding protein MalE
LWYIKPENLSRLAIRQPSRISATTVAPWNSEEYKIVFNSAPYSKSLPIISQWAEIQNIIITDLQKVLQGSQTPQQAADHMASQANALLQKK